MFLVLFLLLTFVSGITVSKATFQTHECGIHRARWQKRAKLYRIEISDQNTGYEIECHPKIKGKEIKQKLKYQNFFKIAAKNR